MTQGQRASGYLAELQQSSAAHAGRVEESERGARDHHKTQRERERESPLLSLCCVSQKLKGTLPAPRIDDGSGYAP